MKLSVGDFRLEPSSSETSGTPMPEFDRHIPVYPIRTVVRLTGVHPRRIRMWERQNGLLTPARTEGGHRLFSEEDVDRIRWIKAMVDRGMSLKGIQRSSRGLETGRFP